MMTKEQFIKQMSFIQNFHSEQETIEVLIRKLIGECDVVTFGNYLIDIIVENIAEQTGLSEDILYWWLYENGEKIIYNTDQSIHCRLDTLEELYNYRWIKDLYNMFETLTNRQKQIMIEKEIKAVKANVEDLQEYLAILRHELDLVLDK